MVGTGSKVLPRCTLAGEDGAPEVASWGLDFHGAILNDNFFPHIHSSLHSRVYKWVLHLLGPAPYWGLHLAGSAPNDDQRDDDSLDNTSWQHIGSKQ